MSQAVPLLRGHHPEHSGWSRELVPQSTDSPRRSKGMDQGQFRSSKRQAQKQAHKMGSKSMQEAEWEKVQHMWGDAPGGRLPTA